MIQKEQLVYAKSKSNFKVVVLFIWTGMVLLGCQGKLSPDELQERLSKAAYEGDISTMRRLITLGADVNKVCCGRSPALHSASSNGHIEIVRFLIENGANVNLPYKGGGTALMDATGGNHPAIVELLLNNGADVNAREPIGNQTALQMARSGGHADIVKILEKHGAKDNESANRRSQ